jgi:hypothetical protein
VLYKVRKYTVRHRVGIGASLVAGVAILLATVVSTWNAAVASAANRDKEKALGTASRVLGKAIDTLTGESRVERPEGQEPETEILKEELKAKLEKALKDINALKEAHETAKQNASEAEKSLALLQGEVSGLVGDSLQKLRGTNVGSLRTHTGKTYENVEITRVDCEQVSIRHSDGSARIPTYEFLQALGPERSLQIDLGGVRKGGELARLLEHKRSPQERDNGDPQRELQDEVFVGDAPPHDPNGTMRRDRSEFEMANLKRRLDVMNSRLAATISELTVLRKKLSDTEATVNHSQNLPGSVLALQVRDKEREVAAMEASIKQLKVKLEALESQARGGLEGNPVEKEGEK